MIEIALKRLVKNSVIYGISGVVQRFMGLLLLPFFTRVLTPEDYGVVALISLVGVAMSGLLTLGTGNSLVLLYFREKDDKKRATIIWTNLLLLVINGIFWYAVLFLLAPTLSYLMFQEDSYASLIRLAFLGSVLNGVTDPWLAYLRMEEKAKLYAVLTLSVAMLTIALSVWLVLFLHLGVFGLILATTIGSGLLLVAAAFVVGSKLSFGINLSKLIPLIRIGFPSIFGLFAFLLIDYADRQMIERILSLSDLGVYSVGYSFGLVINIAMNAFSTAWPPFFMSYVNKQDEARKIFAYVLTYYCISFGVIIVLFFFLAKPVIMIATMPIFYEAWIVVGLVAAAYVLKGCYLIFLPGIYFAEKISRQSMIEWIAALSNIGLNFWLLPVYGIIGAAIATFFSYLLMSSLAWLCARRYLTVDYHWNRLGVIFGIIAVTSALFYLLSHQSTGDAFSDLPINLLLLVGFLVTVYCGLLNKRERQFIKSKLTI